MRIVKITYRDGTVETFSIPTETEHDFLSGLPFGDIASLDLEAA